MLRNTDFLEIHKTSLFKQKIGVGTISRQEN